MAELKKKNIADLPAFASEIRDLLKNPKSLPPVEKWNPEREGEIEIYINASGEWFYQGNKMERLSVVQLLSTIMKKEGDNYFLVSSVEKLKLEVEEVPFVVVMMDVEGEGQSQSLHFSTQVGDCFTLSPEHDLRVSYNEKGEPSPYVHVRAGLEAKLNRSVYYELAEKMEVQTNSIPEALVVKPNKPDSQEPNLPVMGVWSAGKFFVF